MEYITELLESAQVFFEIIARERDFKLFLHFINNLNTIATMPCYCSICFPCNEKIRTRRTIQTHLKDDEYALSVGVDKDHDNINHLRGCIARNAAFLATGELQAVSNGIILF